MADLNFAAELIENSQNKVDTINPDTATDKQYPSVPAVVKYVKNAGSDKNYANNSFANALKGVASGASVCVEDVSPLEHDVKIKLTSGSVTDFSGIKVIVASEQIESVGQLSDAKNGANCVDVTFANGSRKIFMDDTTSVDGPNETVLVFPESNWDTYASVIVRSNSYEHLRYDNADGVSVYRDVPINFYWEHSSSEDGEVDRLLYESYELPEVEGYTAAVGEVFIKDLTVELIAQAGSEIGACEIVVPKVDGTVSDVKSIAPTMAVATDNSAVIVNLEYNRNTNDALSATESRMQNLCSNALKASASGEVIRVDDVSPLMHTVRACLNSVNMLDLSKFVFGNSVYNAETGIATSNIKNGYFCYISSTSPELLNLLYANRGKELCFSVKGELKNGALLSVLIEGDRSSLEQDYEYYEARNNGENHLTFAVPTDFISITRIEFRFNRQGQAFTDTATQFSEFMLNFGTSALPYKPYVDLSTVTVTRCGKNHITKEIPTTKLANGTTIVNNGDGSITITKKVGDIVSIYSEEFYLPKGTYAFSNGLGRDTLQSGLNPVYILIYEGNDGPQVSGASLHNRDKTVITVTNSGYYQLRIYGPADKTPELFTIFPQLEWGEAYTGFEKAKSTSYTPNADGTLEIPSLSPTMTLFADAEGVNIEVEYNKDINAVLGGVEAALDSIIAEQEAIISIQNSLIGGDS